MRRAFGVSVLWVVTAICACGGGRDAAAQANPQPAAKQSIWTLGIYTGPSPLELAPAQQGVERQEKNRPYLLRELEETPCHYEPKDSLRTLSLRA